MDWNYTQSLNLTEVTETVNCYVYNMDLLILLVAIIAFTQFFLLINHFRKWFASSRGDKKC